MYDAFHRSFCLAQDLNDQTSIYLAAVGGHVDLVEYLLSFRVSALNTQEIDKFKRRSTHSYSLSDSKYLFRTNSSSHECSLIAPLTTLAAFNAILDKSNPSFCPFNLDIYSNTGRTALHEAIEQENVKLVHLLISNGANVNLPYEEISSRSVHDEQCFITRSTTLATACRLGNVQLIDYLLNSHATDKEFLAFNACKQSHLIGHLLKYRALQDNEFKITKRQLVANILHGFDEQFWSKIDLTKIWMKTNEEKKDDNNNTISESNYSIEPVLKRRSSKRYQILSTSFEHIKNRFTPRTLFSTNHLSASSTPPSSAPVPSVSVGIQWHHYGPLKTLDPLWFIQASVFVNKETFTQSTDITPANRHLLLHCITRIDLSDNSLENLPSFLFQLNSLRILNVSNNQLGELPNESHLWTCHQLIELDVSHNALTLLPGAVFQLRSLQRAYAGNSFAFDPFPSDHLRVCLLAHNQLQYLPVEMWSAPMLTDLNVANNSLKELPIPTMITARNPEKMGRHMTCV